MELEKILPSNGPSIDEVKKFINKYSNDIIVIKCGGSVLLEKNLFDQFIEDISIINKLGLSAVVVHGGGKNIKKKLDHYNLKSEFIDGLRVTDEKTIKVVEEALIELNFEILNEINKHQANAYSITPNKNNVIKVVPERPELGFVGSPSEIDKDEILNAIKDKKIPNILNERVLSIIERMENDMIELKLNKDFDLDLEKYLIKPRQTSELLITPDIPKQVSDAAPNPNVVNSGQMAQLNNGLTMAENALLSEEEKMIKLRQRGMIT